MSCDRYSFRSLHYKSIFYFDFFCEFDRKETDCLFQTSQQMNRKRIRPTGCFTKTYEREISHQRRIAGGRKDGKKNDKDLYLLLCQVEFECENRVTVLGNELRPRTLLDRTRSSLPSRGAHPRRRKNRTAGEDSCSSRRPRTTKHGKQVESRSFFCQENQRKREEIVMLGSTRRNRTEMNRRIQEAPSSWENRDIERALPTPSIHRCYQRRTNMRDKNHGNK